MEVSALRQTGLPGLPGSAPLLRLQSDERLITLIRRGHHAAFEALVSRYEARLLSFCRHMLGSREDAEDVLQEVFAAAFNAILADDREINARPWLYRIARNRCLNHMRRTAPVGVDSMDIYYAEHGQSTSEKILGRENFRQLIGDVQQLPESQRSALLLREIDALSYEQIAETMETTVPSVKSLLVRARISLAEAAEARQLSCSEVRLALGEAAEGLVKISPPARRHVRNCERCRTFRKHLKDNNHALAMLLPIGPLLMLKKLLLTKLGSTAGAGHVAGASAGGATAGASAVVGAGTAASAGSGLGGLASFGAGALATKAVAGLAAAALVTAGAVEADHASSSHPHSHRSAPRALAAAAPDSSQLPVVVRSHPQPISASVKVTPPHTGRAAHHHAAGAPTKPKPPVAILPATPSTTTTTPADTVKPQPTKPPLTEVQTAKTELPPPSSTTPTQTATQPALAPDPTQTTTTSTDPTPSPSTSTSSQSSEPTAATTTETEAQATQAQAPPSPPPGSAETSATTGGTAGP